MKWLVIAAAMVWLPPAAVAECSSGLPVGFIERIENADVSAPPQIVTAAGKKTVARAQTWLCIGDAAFEIPGPAKVFARSARGVLTTFDSGKLRIDFAPEPAASLGVFAMAAGVFERLGPRRRPIALFTQARDPGQAQPPLRADPLLPSGPQRLPLEYPSVAVLWQGGPGIVGVDSINGKMVTTSSARRAYVTVDLPPVDRLRIQLVDQALAWPVVRDLRADALASGADARVERAVRTLRGGPADERLYALTELALLSAQGHFAAEELWAAARSGELASALGLP